MANQANGFGEWDKVQLRFPANTTPNFLTQRRKDARIREEASSDSYLRAFANRRAFALKNIRRCASNSRLPCFATVVFSFFRAFCLFRRSLPAKTLACASG
jgi:hypothetical protein